MFRCSTLSIALAGAVVGQGVPGEARFGTDDYVEHVRGTLPVVISAGHGGGLEPFEIPDRTYGVRVQDARTERLARELAAALVARTGRHPHLVISHLHRAKLDPNREIVEAAQGDPRAERAWREYHDAIAAARATVAQDWGRGVYIDVHGHGHAIQRIEWGYALTAADLARPDAILDTTPFVDRSTVRHAARLPGGRLSALVRGADSFGGLLQSAGYAGVPSPAIPAPGSDPYFNGGYSVRRHGSRDGGSVDGVQIEFQSDLRRIVPARRAMVPVLADAIVRWIDRHLGIDVLVEPHISITALEPVTTESGAPARLRVSRSGSTAQPTTVLWSVAGRALGGLDYVAVPPVVSIPAGRDHVDVEVRPLPDALDEGDETVEFRLFGGREIGAPAVATVVIRDAGVDPRLELLLRCDAVVGGATPDASPRGRHARLLPTAATGPRVVAGRSGEALFFDGVDDAVQVDDFGYGTAGGFGIAFWFRALPPASGADGFRYVVSHAPLSAPMSLNVYFVEASRTLRTAVEYANRRAPLDHLDVPDDLMDGTFHHYALTVAPRGPTRVWIDGELAAANPLSGDVLDPSGPLTIGARADLDPDRCFFGVVDDLVFLDRPLTGAEIRVLRDAVPGTAVRYGDGCPAGRPPTLAIDGVPETDRSWQIRLRGASFAPAFAGLGLDDRSWLGNPLPFALAGFGGGDCQLLHDLVDAFPTVLDAAGAARVPVAVPRDPRLVGASLFLQGFVLDAGANPLGLAATDGIAVHLGGLR